jgi:hypothetical protein
MITLTREEAQELLYALTYVGDAKDIYSDTINMLRARLAQPDLITPVDVEQLARIEKLIDKIDPYEAQPKPTKIQNCPRCHCHFIDGSEILSPAPEPAAWGIANTRPTEKTPLMMVMLDEPESSPLVVPLYTTPPQRDDAPAKAVEWQGLTDEEIKAMRHMRDWTAGWTDIKYAREIEAKLKEKNA